MPPVLCRECGFIRSSFPKGFSYIILSCVRDRVSTVCMKRVRAATVNEIVSDVIASVERGVVVEVVCVV